MASGQTIITIRIQLVSYWVWILKQKHFLAISLTIDSSEIVSSTQYIPILNFFSSYFLLSCDKIFRSLFFNEVERQKEIQVENFAACSFLNHRL